MADVGLKGAKLGYTMIENGHYCKWMDGVASLPRILVLYCRNP